MGYSFSGDGGVGREYETALGFSKSNIYLGSYARVKVCCDAETRENVRFGQENCVEQTK